MVNKLLFENHTKVNIEKAANIDLMSTEKSLPSDFIKSIYGRPVIVKLFGNYEYKGILLFANTLLMQ